MFNHLILRAKLNVLLSSIELETLAIIVNFVTLNKYETVE